MGKIIRVVIAFIVTWMFFFPMAFTFLPQSVNSKMLVACIGLLFLGIDILTKRDKLCLSKSFVWLVVLACMFSLSCYMSVVVNNTNELDYVTYFISMTVWLLAAYASVRSIKWAHGYTDVKLICHYIILLCCLQCLVALSFVMIPGLKAFFSRIVLIGYESNAWESRLHGLGASYDTAGIRFCVALSLLGYLLSTANYSKIQLFALSIIFWVIFFLGNMMARTTSVGAIVAILYLLYKSKILTSRICASAIRSLFYITISVLVLSPCLILLYNSSSDVRDLAEFGFEFFFHYKETGEIATSSSNSLFEMWSIWPKDLRTWIIGDGRFLDPDDPSFFYMRTDVGYARFVFYCGLLGLSLFVCFFVQLYKMLLNRFPENAQLFAILLLLVFVIWIKVSTDIFFIFAFFFCVDFQESDSIKTMNLFEGISNENSI
jgi:hypothetical protein